MATYTWRQVGGGDFSMPSNRTLDGINPATSPGDVAGFNGKIAGTISGNADVLRIYLFKDPSNYLQPAAAHRPLLLQA